MNKFTFLSNDQIILDNQIDILKKYGTKAIVTDFSVLLGGAGQYENSSNERYGWWWTKTKNPFEDGTECAVDSIGGMSWRQVSVRSVGGRPSFTYSKILKKLEKEVNGIIEIEYGEYPQTIAKENISSILAKKYLNGTLRKTGKSYRTDSIIYFNRDIPFKVRNHIEYEYNGEKYIRFVGDENCNGEVLSDGIIIHSGKPYWVKVEPIKWLIDKKNDIALSKYIIFAGVQFNYLKDYNGDFKNTEMYEFLNTYFAKDIIPSNINRKEIEEVPIYNPYNFDFSEVSEEDILRGCIESNTAVMLHGESGDGKSARVKELDKDAVVVYMLTQGLDSFAGKSVLINNELVDIPPTWYTKLTRICESEPDKLHIVFFDEIANAPPSVQAMAFNVVLEHEINGKWKLPKNARVASAMNEMTESRSSYGLSDPLYNRFAHVYIKTSPNDWLKWAISEESDYEKLEYKEEIKRKIHPSIYAYISYKGDALRTKYTGISPNADPRKWEMASKVLYTTNNPNMIRSLIGEEITVDFINFCTSKVITIEDVLTGNYTDEDLELTTSEKYNTVVALSKIDIEHFEIIREFTKKLGSEMVSLLDTLWATSIEKLEILQEITLSEKVKT